MRHIFVSSQEEVEYETEGTTRELRGNVLSCLISSLLHFLANSALVGQNFCYTRLFVQCQTTFLCE